MFFHNAILQLQDHPGPANFFNLCHFFWNEPPVLNFFFVELFLSPTQPNSAQILVLVPKKSAQFRISISVPHCHRRSPLSNFGLRHRRWPPQDGKCSLSSAHLRQQQHMRSCRRSRGADNRRRAERRSFSPNVQIQMDLAEEEAEVIKYIILSPCHIS